MEGDKHDSGEVSGDDGPASDGGDDGSVGRHGKSFGNDNTVVDPELYMDLKNVSAKLARVGELLYQLDGKSTKMSTEFKGLESSLEFSQREIEDLKKENGQLKKKLGELELEDRRTQFQVQTMDDKLARLETVTKNLLFEGILEQNGKREGDKVISDLFDQLKVNREVNIEACYRIGTYNRARDRPILVSFDKQSDRDSVYARRMDLSLHTMTTGLSHLLLGHTSAHSWTRLANFYIRMLGSS